MKTRYTNGRASANIYEKDEHGITYKDIDSNAVTIVDKLRNNGYEAYIVGGAVRDLMLGRKPKDFDVVTNATPRTVHKLFRYSRIIGRRFKIVHVIFGDKIYEVSTFRSDDNVYGTIEEDCKRRDYSINSLYYDPENQTILDFNNAMSDFKNKKIRSLIPLNRTFDEDPVRMVRGIKYAETTGFKMDFRLRHAIKKYAPNLASIGQSRMTEELNKILQSGCSSRIIYALNRMGLLVYMLPCLSVYGNLPDIYSALDELDEKIKSDRNNVSRADMYFALTKPLLNISDEWKNPVDAHRDIVRQIKVFITPNCPANTDISDAANLYMKSNKILNAKFGKSKHRKN